VTGCCGRGVEIEIPIKTQGIYWLAEKLLAFQRTLLHEVRYLLYTSEFVGFFVGHAIAEW
jgi:hypothetical protein